MRFEPSDLQEIAFSVFAIFAVANTVVAVHMKLQVNRRVPPDDRISWLIYDTKNEIARKYRALEPRSALPAVSRFTSWVCLLTFAAMISTIFFDR